MILIKGFGNYGTRVEQLFPSLNEAAMDKVEQLETDGFIVSIQPLPSHIKTPEQYAATLIDQFTDLYLPETKNLN